MPVYDFRCMKCDTMEEDVILPITHTKGEIPRCCGGRMNYHIGKPPMVVWRDPNIEPFRAVGTKDAPVITSARQNREYMARNNLVDANDLYEPPSQDSEMREIAEGQAAIDAITPNATQAEQMEASGLLDTD